MTIDGLMDHLRACGLLHVACEIANEHGVTIEAMLGPARHKTVAAARHALMCNLRIRGYSYPEIGRLVGRDHTTVIAAVRKCRTNEHAVLVAEIPALPEIPDLVIGG